MRADYVEAVLAVAELIPPGKVLSYGDIAVLLDSGGPRQVGAVMSHHGAAVAWWRVLRASGQPPVHHAARALAQFVAEGTAVRGDTAGPTPAWRVDMAVSRWNPDATQFAALDAVAARLQAGPASGADPTMSEPHDGLQT